ncbi:MAG: 30S ribosomal protein S27e [Nanoarchaeota archaeon]
MESKFLRIKCPRCKTAHIIFGKASTRVKCKKCKESLVRNAGGKAKIKAYVEEIL